MNKPTAILPGALDQLRSSDAVSTNARPADANALGQQQFLDLMVTQLQNQDPFKPMESGDFLGQIAQFSTVSGINDLQQSFQTLASSLQSNQALQASTMVGREVVIPVEAFNFDGAQAVGLSTEIPATATAVRVTITDQSGQIVSQTDLGQQAQGRVEFEWSGLDDNGSPMSAGSYRAQFEAVIGGESQALTAALRAAVESVTLSRDGSPPSLNLSGIGAVAMSDIIEIL